MPSRGGRLAAGTAWTPGAAASCALKSCFPQDFGPAVEPRAAVALLGAVLDLGLEQPWCREDGQHNMHC